jgi:hypothetical protein
MISRFSAFFSSAALVKLNDPVITVSRSMIMILLWAMAWRASMKVGILELARKVAELHFSVRWLLSRIASTVTLYFYPSFESPHQLRTWALG